MVSKIDKLMEYFSLPEEEKKGKVFDALDDDDFEKIVGLNRELRQIQDALEKEIQNLLQGLEIDSDELKSYLKDPSNFSKDEWDKISSFLYMVELAVEEISKCLSINKKVISKKKSREEWLKT